MTWWLAISAVIAGQALLDIGHRQSRREFRRIRARVVDPRRRDD